MRQILAQNPDPQTCPWHAPDDAPDMPQTCHRHTPDDVLKWSQSGPKVVPKWSPKYSTWWVFSALYLAVRCCNWLYLAVRCCNWLYLALPRSVMIYLNTDYHCFCMYRLKWSKAKSGLGMGWKSLKAPLQWAPLFGANNPDKLRSHGAANRGANKDKNEALLCFCQCVSVAKRQHWSSCLLCWSCLFVCLFVCCVDLLVCCVSVNVWPSPRDNIDLLICCVDLVCLFVCLFVCLLCWSSCLLCFCQCLSVAKRQDWSSCW